MKYILSIAYLMSILLPLSIQAQTIDKYVEKHRVKPGSMGLWQNGIWVSVETYDPNNIDKMLKELFKRISYDEGKPNKWTIIESKVVDFGYGEYLIVRIKAFNKEHMHFFSSKWSKVDNGYPAR